MEATPSMEDARQNGDAEQDLHGLATGGDPPSNGTQITEEYNKSANVGRQQGKCMGIKC